MVRTPLARVVPALIATAAVAILLTPAPGRAQADIKPRPNAANPPVVETHPTTRSAPDRERVTMRIAVGERAPDFELDQIDGTPLRLSKLRGDWVMLFFVERRESLD